MYAEELDPRSRGHAGNYPPRLMHLHLRGVLRPPQQPVTQEPQPLPGRAHFDDDDVELAVGG